MFFKSKAPEKDRNAAANTAEVIERMVQQQHSVVEQVAASPPVPALRAGEIKEVEMLKTYSRDAEAFVGHAGAGLL